MYYYLFYSSYFINLNVFSSKVMRMRCLECELSTYRSQPFTNINVPLPLEDPEDVDGMTAKELFLKQILQSETLKEDNKYWCEQCGRLNEAQRSVQYELLPNVLVLQLNRFTAAAASNGGGCYKSSSSSSASYVSKINDYMPTPFEMDCFCAECVGAHSRLVAYDPTTYPGGWGVSRLL